MPPFADLLALCAALGLAQLVVTLRFYLLFRKDFSASPSGWAPRVCVLCACKGASPGLEENAAALLAQDYPGAEFLFVVPSESDPAYGRLKRRTKVWVSGEKPVRCGGKNLDLLYALKQVPEKTEVLVFVDSDVRVPSGWLKNLISPLQDPSVGAATAAALYVPEGFALWPFLRFLYMGASIPYLELMDCVTGQSCAIRKKEFYDLGVPEIWARSLMDDLSLSARLRQAGGKVRFVPSAMPTTPAGPCGPRGLFAQFNRWVRMFRVYVKSVWVFGVLVTATKTYALAWSFLHLPSGWPVAALVLGMDVINLFWLFSIYGRFPLLAALAAPILQAVYLINFLASFRLGDIIWGGVRYRLRGPQDVEVVG